MLYKGFISYSHAADARLAPALRSALRRIGQPWYRRAPFRIFLDESSLSANPALWDSIEAALAQEEAFAPHYILEVTRPGRLDELEIIVETRTTVAPDAAAQLANHAAHLIKSKVGVTAKVRAVVPGSIERSQGKAKRVLDKRSRL